MIRYPFVHESILFCDLLFLKNFLHENRGLPEMHIRFERNNKIFSIAKTTCLPLLMTTVGYLF